MKIAIGNDHVGYELKNHLIKYLSAKGFELVDFGAYSEERSDYPIYGEKVARAVANCECALGILICGTGVGISIAANKVKGIRAVVCSEPYSAKLSKRHNHANIVAFGARVIGVAMAEEIVDAFLEAEFESGRHSDRVDLISDIERRERLV
jgi:ribose 5-phosphate isomerase B